MILFPNAKINVGLKVVGRRPDGYHDIDTVMVPVDWCDVLEIVPSRSGETTLTVTGRRVDCPAESNLVMKAYRALCNVTGGLPPVDIYLEKIIPDGAGMGGGSADAAFALIGLDSLFSLGMGKERLAEVAALIGSDCPFFIYNRPARCTGRGEIIDLDAEVNLSGASILIAKPRVASVSTKKAYEGVTPGPMAVDLKAVVRRHPKEWGADIHNDFEDSIFPLLPEVEAVKKHMLDSGAVYASMTGSGAAVYGIYGDDKMARRAAETLTGCDVRIVRAID